MFGHYNGVYRTDSVFGGKIILDECIGRWRQPKVTPGKGRRTLADLRVAILFSECIAIYHASV